mgnify:CR=1 FL=1
MNLKERIQTVLQKLNLLDKAKANQLTQEIGRASCRERV